MKSDAPAWQASWTQAVTNIRGMASETRDVTLRFTIPLALGGTQARFVLSNRSGTESIHIGHAALVLGDISAQVTFSGAPTVEVTPGGEVTCDPVDILTSAGENLIIDLYLPKPTEHATGNLTGCTWGLSEPGNHAGLLDFPALPEALVTGPGGVQFVPPAPLLRDVEVQHTETGTIVACLGDSITAAGWPNRASALLQGSNIALLNRGIAGNRLRKDCAGFAGAFFGRSGLTRFDDDVLNTAGVTHAIIALGTNDLGHPGSPTAPAEAVPAATDLIDALSELVHRSRSAGICPILATITPFMQAEGYDPAREAIRQQVNTWIRSDAPVATVIDFDRALQSATDETVLASQYDSGDHLHPNEAGQDRLAREAALAFQA